MKLNVLIFKNLLIDAFTQPIFDDHATKDAAEQLRRSLIVEKDITKVNPYKNLQLFCIGSFDDHTGIIESHEPELLLDCSEIVKGRADYVESKPIER